MSQMRPETDDTAGEISSKRLRTLLIDDDDDDDNNNEESMMMEESGVVEIMKSFEAELNYPCTHQMKYSRSSSSSSLSIMNGFDVESCGPSFSDSSSTVMASLDISSTCFSYLVGPIPTPTTILDEDSLSSSSSSSPNLGFTGEGEEEEKNEINGGDHEVEEEDEDEWLERVLYETPIEEELFL